MKKPERQREQEIATSPISGLDNSSSSSSSYLQVGVQKKALDILFYSRDSLMLPTYLGFYSAS